MPCSPELLSPYLDGVLIWRSRRKYLLIWLCAQVAGLSLRSSDLVNILKDLLELSPSSGFSARVIKM